MSKVSLHRLLSRLAAIALSTSAVGAPAEAAGTSTSSQRFDEDDLAVAELPIDPEYIDPPDAAVALGRGLALALTSMRPLAATQIAASWALSSDHTRRLALAHALEWSFRLVGDSIVIDHLSRDPDPAVRTSIARAAWARQRTLTDMDALDRLAEDPDPEVRRVARRSR